MATQNNVIIKKIDDCKLRDLSNNLSDLSNNVLDLLNTLNNTIKVNNDQTNLINDLQYKLLHKDDIDCSSYNNNDTTPLQSNRDVVDDYQSHHYYDKNGPTSENLQNLQLESVTAYPSNLAAAMNCCYYEDNVSAYMFGVSTQSIFYSGATDGENFNGMTKRELFNLLQDIETIKSDFKDASNNTGFAAFVDVWNRGFEDKNDRYTTGLGSRLGFANASIALKYGGSDDSWTLGNYSSVWRYDIKNKNVISRHIVNMNKELDISGDWIFSASGRGPVNSLGDGRFCVSVPNFSSSGLLVFDKNLKPITNIISSSFDIFTRGVFIDPYRFDKRGQLSFGIYQDQVNSVFTKTWSPSELSGLTFKSLITGNTINIFNTDSGNATLLYLNSSSQGQYGSCDATSGFLTTTVMTPLADYKWNQSKGKILQYALFKDSNNKWQLEPVNVFYTCPDDYVAGDKLQIDSFVTDPDTGVTQPLKIYYPIIDNRDSVVNVGNFGNLRSNNVWREGYKQLVFSDGSNNTLPVTAGLQSLSVNIFDVSGGSPGLYFNSPTFYQDVYATLYKKYTDVNNNIYFKQDDLTIVQVIITDPKCAFYPATNPKKYIDLSTNVTYLCDNNGIYKDSNNNTDPHNNRVVRQLINNNGFAKRYMFSPYQLDPSGNGLNTPTGFSDVSSNINPMLPPFNPSGFSSNSKNTGSQYINPDFYFSNGHVFDSTQYYYSRPYSLLWKDTRMWLNTYALGAASLPNTNYGQTKLLDANNVKEFFRLCQTAQSQNISEQAVQVITYDDLSNNNYSYTDLSGNTVINNQQIVFRVRGDVFNGQPLLMTIHPNCAGNLTLTQLIANQLNIYGAGIYGKLSLMQDSKGNHHMLGGAGNTNYMPYSDMFYPAEYTANRLKNEIQNAVNNLSNNLPISVSTLKRLGFDNVNWNNQPSNNEYYRNVKSAIRDNNGNVLIDCTLRGINEFKAKIAYYASKWYANENRTILDYNGNSLTYKTDVACAFEFALPITGPKGEKIMLSGNESNEALELMYKVKNYRSLCISPRLKRLVTAKPYVINPKNMQLEHIIRGPLDMTELFTQTVRDWFKLTGESLLIDCGYNRDEVNGVVTCGDKYFSSASKSTVRTFNKLDIEGAQTKCKTYPDISGNRKNFSVISDGIMGTNVNPNGSITYGSRQFYVNQALSSSIAGSNSYVGKINGKDVFVFCSTALNSYSGNLVNPDIIPILNNCKYNNFENLRNSFKSDDGQVIIIPPRLTAGLYRNISRAIDKPQGHKIMCAYTQSDDGSKVQPLWITGLPVYNYPELTKNLPSANDQTGNSHGAVTLVNDLIFECGGRDIYVIKASTGEIIQTISGSDLDFDEKNDRVNGYTGDDLVKKANVISIGAVNYAKGELHLISGARRFANNISSWGRSIYSMKLKLNDKLNLNYNSLYLGDGSVDIVFKPEDIKLYNNNKFVLISTFMTNDRFGKLLSNYHQLDLSYNMLYHVGITAIAIDCSNDYNLNNNNNNNKFEDKIINGGSWYCANKLSFNSIKSRILFLYAGQIPTRCANQSPYIINDNQIFEAKTIRNQKILLREYNRKKNNNTYPYPDNGSFILGNSATGNNGYLPINDIKYTYYQNPSTTNTINDYNSNFNKYNYSVNNLPGQSQIWNQPLGYTDVGTGRPFLV